MTNNDTTTGKNVLIHNCKSFSNRDGIFINGPEDPGNIVIINCQVYNNTRYGMYFAGGEITERTVVAYNYIANNGSDGVRIDASNINDNFFFRNTIVENGGNSINNAAGAANSFLGNYAFKSSGTNYVNGGSVINATTVTTSSAFGTQPAFWRNIDATP